MTDLDPQREAFILARRAAELDFGYALQGLLAGHDAKLKQMSEALSKKDMAFLMALALSEKGARIDKDGVIAQKIIEGLRGLPTCETERKFIQRHTQRPDEEEPSGDDERSQGNETVA